MLLESLCALPKLRTMNLHKNDLKSPAGHYIARVISFHGQRRDREVWAGTLRGEERKGGVGGLAELGLAESGLDDKSGEEILHALGTDVWLQSIDLHSNPLTLPVLQDFLRLFHSNPSLRVLDLRHIPPASPLLPSLLKRMKRKMKKVKADPDSQFLFLKYQEILENADVLASFPVHLLYKSPGKGSESVSASFVATAVTSPPKDRRRVKSAGPNIKRLIQPATVPRCLKCASFQLQLRTAHAKIALLEKQLSVTTDESRPTKGEALGEDEETLVLRAEQLVQELVQTLDVLDRMEGR